MHTRKLMVALAESNFYSALGVARKALLDADELGESAGCWARGATRACWVMIAAARRRSGRACAGAALRGAWHASMCAFACAVLAAPSAGCRRCVLHAGGGVEALLDDAVQPLCHTYMLY